MSRHPDKRTNVGHNFNYMCTLNITDDNNNKQIVPQPSKLPGRPRSFHTLSHASAVPSSSPLPSVTSGSDPHGTRNADSDGRPKRSRTSEGESERRGIEAGVRLDVDKHAGGP